MELILGACVDEKVWDVCSKILPQIRNSKFGLRVYFFANVLKLGLRGLRHVRRKSVGRQFPKLAPIRWSRQLFQFVTKHREMGAHWNRLDETFPNLVSKGVSGTEMGREGCT